MRSGRNSSFQLWCWLVSLPALPLFAGPPEDFQFRARWDVRSVETAHLTVNTFGEVRLTDDASKVTNYRVSQQVQYHPWSSLSLGVGYTFIDQDGLDSVAQKISHTHTHRAELDATPHLRLGDGVQLNWRARFENRWIDHRDSWSPQFRTRPELVFSLSRSGWLREFYANNEFFYDLTSGRQSENRLVPAGFTFALGSHSKLRLNYLLDSVHAPQNWVHIHVVQTQWIFSLH